jgi:hypothetical protein
MKKFAILAGSLMLLVAFGCVNVAAVDCVYIKGNIIGAYENIWCEDQLEKTALSSISVRIDKLDDKGNVVDTRYTSTDKDGYYEQEVKKGTFFSPEQYKVTYQTTKKVIDGETYTFPGQSKTVNVKGRDEIVNFNPVGDISLVRALLRTTFDFSFVRTIIQTFFARFA